MKNQFTKEFRAILEQKLRVYHRHYRKKVRGSRDIKFKEFCRKSACITYSSQPFAISILHNVFSPDCIKIKIGKATFFIVDSAEVLATVYRNANRKDCRC